MTIDKDYVCNKIEDQKGELIPAGVFGIRLSRIFLETACQGKLRY